MREWFTGSGRRRRTARRLPDGPLRRYLETPPPEPSTPLADLPLLAMDVETTGLDPRRDRVLSVGLVPVDGDRIVLGGARSLLLRAEGADIVGVAVVVDRDTGARERVLAEGLDYRWAVSDADLGLG